MGDLLSPKMNLPEVKPVKQADPEDENALEARRKKIRDEQASGGRESTNLTSGPGPVTYGNSQLGS